MEYMIIREVTVERLSTAVNRYLNQGWSPQGGLACMCTPGMEKTYLQAMIREEK